MNAYRLKPLRFPWPPLLYAGAVLSAIVLNRFVALPALHLHNVLAWSIGAILVVAGVVLSVWAVKTLVECKTTFLPNRCASHLVTRGPFRLSRNPIYLGYTLVTAGIGLLSGNSWFLVMAILCAIAITFIAIRYEERHLLARFGIEFEHYCKQTRRWI